MRIRLMYPYVAVYLILKSSFSLYNIYNAVIVQFVCAIGMLDILFAIITGWFIGCHDQTPKIAMQRCFAIAV
jgi:hypothetical protein